MQRAKLQRRYHQHASSAWARVCQRADGGILAALVVRKDHGLLSRQRWLDARGGSGEGYGAGGRDRGGRSPRRDGDRVGLQIQEGAASVLPEYEEAAPTT